MAEPHYDIMVGFEGDPRPDPRTVTGEELHEEIDRLAEGASPGRWGKIVVAPEGAFAELESNKRGSRR